MTPKAGSSTIDAPSTNYQLSQLNTTPVNYGVKIEMVFAFRENELSLKKSEKVIKHLSYAQREQYPEFTRIPPVMLPNRTYNSWGIKNQKDGQTRRYTIEPQTIMQRKINQRLPHILTRISDTIYGSRKTIKEMEEYKGWLITVDHSVCGVGSQNISTRLPHVTKKDCENWDSYGIELVSPIFNTGVPAHNQQVSEILNTITVTGKDSYGAFITNQCGLHVHIEAPKDLVIIKELAILLVIFESEISRLHSPCRRPGHAATHRQLDSNRIFFLKGHDIDFDEGTVDFSNLDCSTRALRQKMSIQAIRNRINLIKNKESLSQKMNYPPPPDHTSPNGNRNRLVNFVSMTRGPSFASTIEFRQARGTLDPVEIGHWVDFCVKLVKVAEYYATNPDNFILKKWEDMRGEGGTTDVFDLMRDMELSNEARRFWEGQAEKYARYQAGDENDRTDNEVPPEDEGHIEGQHQNGTDDEENDSSESRCFGGNPEGGDGSESNSSTDSQIDIPFDITAKETEDQKGKAPNSAIPFWDDLGNELPPQDAQHEGKDVETPNPATPIQDNPNTGPYTQSHQRPQEYEDEQQDLKLDEIIRLDDCDVDELFSKSPKESKKLHLPSPSLQAADYADGRWNEEYKGKGIVFDNEEVEGVVLRTLPDVSGKRREGGVRNGDGDIEEYSNEKEEKDKSNDCDDNQLGGDGGSQRTGSRRNGKKPAPSNTVEYFQR